MYEFTFDTAYDGIQQHLDTVLDFPERKDPSSSINTPGVLLVNREISGEAMHVLRKQSLVFTRPPPLRINTWHLWSLTPPSRIEPIDHRKMLELLQQTVTMATLDNIRHITIKIPALPPFESIDVTPIGRPDRRLYKHQWANLIAYWLHHWESDHNKLERIRVEFDADQLQEEGAREPGFLMREKARLPADYQDTWITERDENWTGNTEHGTRRLPNDSDTDRFFRRKMRDEVRRLRDYYTSPTSPTHFRNRLVTKDDEEEIRAARQLRRQTMRAIKLEAAGNGVSGESDVPPEAPEKTKECFILERNVGETRRVSHDPKSVDCSRLTILSQVEFSDAELASLDPQDRQLHRHTWSMGWFYVFLKVRARKVSSPESRGVGIGFTYSLL